MNLFELTLTLPSEYETLAWELLCPLFTHSPVTYESLEKQESHLTWYWDAPPPENALPLIHQTLRPHFPSNATQPYKLKIKRLPAKNWNESWKLHFPPLQIGSQLLLKPTWDSTPLKKGQKLITLDPGLSFGTGHHPTTQFCLEELIQHQSPNRRTPKTLLDLGCGSGILAIAAAKFGYQEIKAWDYDPQCIRVARKNAQINEVKSLIRFAVKDLTQLNPARQKSFDVVCANLLYDLLIEYQATLTQLVKPGGTLILAGILATQFPLIQKAYQDQGWKMTRSKKLKEWRSGTFQSKFLEKDKSV